MGNHHPAFTLDLPRAFCCSDKLSLNFRTQIKFLWSFCLLGSCIQGPYQVRPSSCSWRWIWAPPQPFCTLPYSQVSRRNWKKSGPGIGEIRAGHCLQPGHGPLHCERDTHFFKILPQLLVFCFTSLPCSLTVQTSSLDFSTQDQQSDTSGSLVQCRHTWAPASPQDVKLGTAKLIWNSYFALSQVIPFTIFLTALSIWQACTNALKLLCSKKFFSQPPPPVGNHTTWADGRCPVSTQWTPKEQHKNQTLHKDCTEFPGAPT